MIKNILFTLALLLCGSVAHAQNDVYIALTAAGGNTGVDCADAKIYTYFNTGGNWSGSPTGIQIGPNTTVHLCGTFTASGGTSGMLAAQGSDTSGNVIRIQFETGANATAPYWGTNGFINLGSQAYFQIDGSPTSTPCGYVNGADVSCNGTIQATANGASLANQHVNAHAINLTGHDVEVRNVNCQNLFVAVQNSSNNETTSGPNNTSCVWWEPSGGGGGNINVHNIQVNQSWQGVLYAYTSSNSGMHVDNSWMQNIDVCAQIGATGSGASISSGSFNNNDCSNMAPWDAPGDANHHEFLHLYTQQNSSSIGSPSVPFQIMGNYLHGTLGANMTAEIYVECDSAGLCGAPTALYTLQANNVIVNTDPNADISTGAGGNGMSECEGATCQIYNNTYYSNAHYSSDNFAQHCESSSVITGTNNIFVGMNQAFANGGCTLTASVNVGYGLNVSCGSNCSVSANPNLNTSSSPPYQIQSGSSAIGAGTNLTSLGYTPLDSDQLGHARPSSGAWTMGAFNFISTGGCSGSSPNWMSASASNTDITACVTAASSGDMIVVPAGTVSFSAAVSIPSNKCLTIDGQGGVTITNVPAFVINESNTCESRVTGFTFTGNSGNQPSTAVVFIGGTFTSRLDHNTFTATGTQIFVVLDTIGSGGQTYPALIDHNTFNCGYQSGSACEAIHNEGANLTPSTQGWTNNVTPGGPNMVFIENNTFNQTGGNGGNQISAVEQFYGSQTVIRYNTVNYCGQFDAHGTAGYTGARWWEIYNNQFNQNSYSCPDSMQLRGGSGVVFNNVSDGTSTNSSPCSPKCMIDIFNENGSSGTWPNEWQVGSGINGYTNGHASCPGPTNNAPAQLWNNTNLPIGTGGGISGTILINRDYFSSASQPGTINWEEQSGDTCSTTYTYTPYTYPHPLDVSTGSITVTPTSLAFGAVLQGHTSAGMNATITNNTGVVITFSAPTFSGTNGTDFSSTGCSSGTLANGSGCPITVKFTPSAAPITAETGMLNIHYTGFAGPPVGITLTGTSGNSTPPAAPTGLGNTVN